MQHFKASSSKFVEKPTFVHFSKCSAESFSSEHRVKCDSLHVYIMSQLIKSLSSLFISIVSYSVLQLEINVIVVVAQQRGTGLAFLQGRSQRTATHTHQPSCFMWWIPSCARGRGQEMKRAGRMWMWATYGF